MDYAYAKRDERGLFVGGGEGRVCVVPGCGEPQPEKAKRGFCHKHYTRWRRTGSTDDPLPRLPKVLDAAMEARLRALWAEGPQNIAQISAKVSAPKATVYGWLAKLGLGADRINAPRKRENSELKCVTEDCDNRQSFRAPRGLCDRCYSRLRRTGSTEAPAKAPKVDDHWSPERLDLLKTMWLGDAPAGDIAVATATTVGAVYKKAQRLGLPPRLRGKLPAWTEGETELLKALWAEGKMMKEIQERLGKNLGTIAKHVRRLSLPDRPFYRVKVFPREGWTAEDDAVLKDMWTSGFTTAEIAEELECSQWLLNRRGRNQLGLPPAVRVRPIDAKVEPVAFSKLANKVIAPGIEKHLVPLLHFKGSADLGRVHRLWNFTLALKQTEIETMSDAVKLANHPSFSHLCEPVKGSPFRHLGMFFNRLMLKPGVCGLEPGLLDYVRGLARFAFELTPVSEASRERNHAWWRHYEAPVKTKAEQRDASARKAIPRVADLQWPYIAHNHAKPTEDGMDVVTAINRAVGRGMPDDVRADICQDLILGVLEGKFSVEDIKDNPRKYVSSVRDMSPWKYEWVSLDAPMYGDEGRTLADVLPG